VITPIHAEVIRALPTLPPGPAVAVWQAQLAALSAQLRAGRVAKTIRLRAEKGTQK
jgi:hypothetical protein